MNVWRKFSAARLWAYAFFALADLTHANTPSLSPPTSEASRAALAARVADSVRRSLAATATPRIELLDATLQASRLTLNFSREALALAPGSLAFEAWSHEIHNEAADILREEPGDFEIHTLIAGVPLHQILDLTDRPPVARQISPPPDRSDPNRAALNGRRIALSPGHGYYLNASNRFVLQRSFFTGIVEDFVNHDFVTLVAAQLTAWGADVRPTRHLDRAAGDGESGFPRWQEAARYHVKALGAATSVWNEAGFDDLSQDIRCRPLYANAIGAELLVSLHNNGGGGTGTETLYDTNHVAATESKRLADLLHARVIAAIRRDYDPTWTDRRVQGFNGSYGENRLATRPAVIIEIAFMDRATPDNVALRDERFKRLVSAAIADGIREFVEGPVPAPPGALAGTGDFSAITLTWTDNATNETGYRVERRDSAAAEATVTWTTVATLPAGATSHRDATVTAGASYIYRVQAFNAAGASGQSSNEATVVAVPEGSTLSYSDVTLFSPGPGVPFTWGEEVIFRFHVVNSFGRRVAGATVSCRDPMTNSVTVGTTDGATPFFFRTIVPAGQANANYEFEFRAAKTGYAPGAALTRSITVSRPVSALPVIAQQPAAQTVTAGSAVTFTVAATGSALAYQWERDGAVIAGATAGSYTIASVSAADTARYRVVVRNANGALTSVEAALTVQPAAWLTNLSLRTSLDAGRNVIVGFVVSPPGKQVLVRAAGPALAAFGLTTAMADPRLEVFIGPVRDTENNDWPATLAPVFSTLGAFAFPAGSRDAALQQFIFGPASVVVTGTAGGVVLVEGYDAGAGSAVRLVNLSARNRVGTGADAMIAGFVIAGTGTQRVLIRAIGPTLAAFGVTAPLTDPRLEVRDAAGRIAENDNWDASLASVFAQAGAFALPTGSRDAAVVLTLAAGRSYTAQVSAVGTATGEALVEVYEVP